MNDSNDSTLSSIPELTEDSLDETAAQESLPDEITSQLDNLPIVRLNILSELKTLTKVAARDENEEQEDETLADMDQLQLDLERLLSHIVVMRRGFQATLDAMAEAEPRSPSALRRRKNRLKRSRQNAYVKRKLGRRRTTKINVEIITDLPSLVEKTPVKLPLVGKTTPVKYNGAIGGGQGGKTPSKSHTKEGNRSSSLCYIPKNNSAEVFWQSVRPYVDDVGDTDVKLIEDMIQGYESERGAIPEIPALGDHYTRSISDPAQLLSITSRLKKFKSSSAVPGMDRGDGIGARLKHGCDQIVFNNNLHLPNTLIDRIVSVLHQCSPNSDENEVPNLECIPGGGVNLESDDKQVALNESDNTIVKLNGDIINDEDEEEDEVLAEILKCRSELSQVCSENKSMLSSLLEQLVFESRRNKIQAKLTAIDTELCGIVRKLSAARQKAETAGTPLGTPFRKDNVVAAANHGKTPSTDTAKLLRSPAPTLNGSHPETTSAIKNENGLGPGHALNGLPTFSGHAPRPTPGHPNGLIAVSGQAQNLLATPALKIRRYEQRALLYLKMRDVIVSLLGEFRRDAGDLTRQFQSSMDIDAYLLKAIIQNDATTPPPASIETQDVGT
ncbi:hypothetical protein M8J76_004872 [Diaphorina citri]|nr:hypothetical protein M8J76_004872 [Diaphorina citri]